MRINEAFGDTVNWDLIPTAAIRSVTVVTNNPAFGLNALGGAVNVLMKDGFNYHGAEINTMGGSFGRIQSSAQYGKQIDNWSVYGALEGLRDNGYRNFSELAIRRFYGDVGYRTDSSEFHLNFGVAKNNFGASAAVPVELLQKYWGATYTTPQTTDNRVAYANLTGKVEVTPTWTIDGSVRVRAFRQKTVDGNPTEAAPCDADATLLCFNEETTPGAPANGLNGVQLANPFPTGAVLGEIDRTTTRSTTTGATLQATNTDQLFGHNNQFMVGTSFDSGVTRFGASGELGTIGSNYVVSGSGIFLGPSGDPDFNRPGLASRHQPLHRPLCARHVRRNRPVLNLGWRPVQLCKHQPSGPDRHRSQRQSYVQPLQSDDWRHLQGYARSDGLCRILRSQSCADPAGTRMRRPCAPLYRRRIPDR